jgi:hypothetical protein
VSFVFPGFELLKAKSLSLPATRPKMTSVELVSRRAPDTEIIRWKSIEAS